MRSTVDATRSSVRRSATTRRSSVVSSGSSAATGSSARRASVISRLRSYRRCTGSAVVRSKTTRSVSATASPSATSTSDATPTDNSDSGTDRSERGNIVKRVGQPAGVSDPDDPDDVLVNFTVKDIRMDAPCSGSFPDKPENGHFVTVDIAAETGSAATFKKLDYIGDFTFSSGLWKFITPQGTTVNSIATGPSFTCLDEKEQLPVTLGPAEKATGKIVLDVPTTEGTLIFSDLLAEEGWEWKVPGN